MHAIRKWEFQKNVNLILYYSDLSNFHKLLTYFFGLGKELVLPTVRYYIGLMEITFYLIKSKA